MTDPSLANPPDAIFIVGVSRSGTTLMRRVLETSSHIGIATENHYLGHLLPGEGVARYFASFGDQRDDAVVRRIVEAIHSGELATHSRFRGMSPYWQWLIANVDRERLEERLLASDRTQRGFFEAFLRLYAERKGRSIIGEKTPAHIRYAETLFEWFPNARIVHMIRDPRAIFVSEVRRRQDRPDTFPYRQLVRVPTLFRLFLLLQTTLVWADAVGRDRRLRARYPGRYRLVRFEDLVSDPATTIENLFAFLGVPLEEKVLQRQRVVSKGFQQGQKGFDAEAASRWRAQIPAWAAGWLERTLGRRMTALGYAVGRAAPTATDGRAAGGPETAAGTVTRPTP